MSQLTKAISNSGPGGFIQTLTGNTGGPISPTAGNINVPGGNNITSSGNPGTSTITFSVTGTTNHSILLGNATGSINSLGVASNGQLPIGSVGADPVLSTLTAGTGISIANGPGSIIISSAGTIATTYTEDTGTATPALGNLNILGTAGRNISTSGAGSTVSIAVSGTTNHSLQLGNATGSLSSLGVATNGQIPIGSVGVDPVLNTLTPGTGISITNGAGTITIASTGTTTLTYTNVTTTPYVVLSTDEYLSVDTSALAITIQLPNAATLGRSYVIKDRTGAAATRNITVTTVGGAVNIDGATTFVINTNFQSINIIGNGSTYEVY